MSVTGYHRNTFRSYPNLSARWVSDYDGFVLSELSRQEIRVKHKGFVEQRLPTQTGFDHKAILEYFEFDDQLFNENNIKLSEDAVWSSSTLITKALPGPICNLEIPDMLKGIRLIQLDFCMTVILMLTTSLLIKTSPRCTMLLSKLSLDSD